MNKRTFYDIRLEVETANDICKKQTEIMEACFKEIDTIEYSLDEPSANLQIEMGNFLLKFGRRMDAMGCFSKAREIYASLGMADKVEAMGKKQWVNLLEMSR